MLQVVREMQFPDAEQISAALHDSRPEIIPLERSSRPWSVGYARLGECTLWWGAMGARSAAHGRSPEDLALISLGGLEERDYSVNRTRVGNGRAIFLAPGEDFACSYSSPGEYCFLAARPDWLNEQAAVLGIAGLELAQRSTAIEFGVHWGHVKRAVAGVRAFALRHPGRLADEGCRKSLQATLVDAICRSAARHGPRYPANDDAIGRRLVAYLREHPSEPINQADVCRAIRTSQRSLRRVVPQLFGTTPGKYLRMRRLRLARRALVSGECRNVAQAAARYGFFDFGRFASAYRTIFAELPSESLRRRTAGAAG